MRRLVWTATLLLAFGCSERKSSTGWAAQVPADATRYVEQEPNPAPAVEPEEAPPIVAEPAPVEETWTSEITEPTTVTLWHAYRATERTALKKVVEAYHALGTKVTIKPRIVPFDAFNDKIKVVVPEGRGPDLFIFAHDLVGAWSEMEIIEPLNSWTTEKDTAPFLPNTVKALVYRNALYGLPMAFKCVALYYNKAMVKVPPATIEDLMTLAKASTDAANDRWGLVYEAANLYFHAPWIHGYDGQVLDDSDKAWADTDPAENALKFARRLLQEDKVAAPSVTAAMVSGYFNDGKAAMVINGPWMRGELEGVDYGVATMPTVEGRPAKPFLGVEAVFLNKKSQNKKAALEVMRFLVSNQSAAIRAEVGKQPVANQAIWDSGKGVDDVMKVFYKQAADSVGMSGSPRMQQVWTPYNDALLSVVAGEAEPREALGTAQKKMEADMLRAGGGQ